MLISIVFAAGALWTVPAQAQISPNQVAAFVEALRLAAPKTGAKNNGLYSSWKVKPENIRRWSLRCTGAVITPAQFAANPAEARKIIICVMDRILREQYGISRDESIAVRRAASWWLTGDPAQYDAPQTRHYTKKVLYDYERALLTVPKNNG